MSRTYRDEVLLAHDVERLSFESGPVELRSQSLQSLGVERLNHPLFPLLLGLVERSKSFAKALTEVHSGSVRQSGAARSVTSQIEWCVTHKHSCVLEETPLPVEQPGIKELG